MSKVFTGEVPFNRVTSADVPMLITTGKRPERPNHPEFTTVLWTLTQRCWAAVAQDRPKMKEVVEVLEDLSVFIPHLHGRRFTHITSGVSAELPNHGPQQESR